MGSIKLSLLLACLVGAAAAAPAVEVANEADVLTGEVPADADTQAERVEPPPAGGPAARNTPAPDLEERRCANVAVLDSDRMCRYATPQTPTAVRAQVRDR
jgi:hypothetical protein